jgi:pimeloyl-ACP methyl ester carboxylesterase
MPNPLNGLCNLHYIEAGAGPPLLLIHGLFDSLRTWEKLIPLLSPHFKVYAIDLPAFGKSVLPDRWGKSISGMIESVVAFLDERSIPMVSLAGNSMGGSLSLAIAGRHPGRVERLVLINPYGLPTLPVAAEAAGKLISGTLLPYLLRKEALKRGAKMIFGRSLYDQSLMTDELIDQVVLPFSSLRQRKNLFRFLKGISTEEIQNIDALLPEVKRPVLILWGENDRWLPEAHLVRLQQRLPQNKVAKISHCGHLPQMDKPQEIAAAMIPFLMETEPER